jgi:hypothetical protein
MAREERGVVVEAELGSASGGGQHSRQRHLAELVMMAERLAVRGDGDERRAPRVMEEPLEPS